MTACISGTYKIDNMAHYIINSHGIFDVTNNITNKCILPGDTVELNKNNEKIIVTRATKECIPGILHISSKVSFGINGHGNIIKKFTPFDKNMPSFLVSTKKRFQANDIYAIIKFEYWRNNLCYGSIVRYIGDVGEIKYEHEYIQLCATSTFTNINKMNLVQYEKDMVTTRIDLRNETVYSIDPMGCRDIDDALHIKEISDAGVCYEVGIHIADVSAFIPTDSPLDLEICKRGESIYLSGRQINMIPDSLSLNKFSLLEKSDRMTFSVIVNINKDGTINKCDFVRAIINVKENLTYDRAQKIIDNNDKNYSSLITLYELAKTICNNKSEFDTHKLVEIYMIMANSLVAKKLYEIYGSNAIVRKHNYCNSSNKSNTDDLSPNILNKINVYNYDKAEYCFAKNNFKHHGLNLEYYTHFTSPIRRYIDIVIHRMLGTHIQIGHDIIYNLNCAHSKYRTCQIKSYVLSKIEKLDSKIINTHGHIIGFDGTNVRIYINNLDLDIDVELLPTKLKHLVDVIPGITLISKENGNTIELYVGQIVQIIVAITLKDIKKIKVKITTPNIQELYGPEYDD